MKLRHIAVFAIAGVLLPLLLPASALADTPFQQRYRADQRGSIIRAANSIVSCYIGLSATAPSCDAARGGASTSNNSFAFEFIDVDGDPSTFDSSSATLKLPATATVTHAELYWGANLKTTRDTPGLPAGNRSAPDAAKKNEVKFKVPGGSYQTLTADAVYDLNIGRDPAFQARKDVTSLVQKAGVYTVADIQAARGSSDLGPFGGWTLVVAYKDPSEHLRNLTIYDGLLLMERFKTPITIDLTGFETPKAGAVNARMGWVVYDGDKSGTGDQVKIKTNSGPETTLSDAANPASNPFNSSITTMGSDESGRSPDYKNTLGYDSDVENATPAFRNGDTSLRITMSTNNENYAPGVIFMQIDLYEAHATIKKKAKPITAPVPGDKLEYTITVASDGDVAAENVRVSDAIPANTTYVPGSLKIAGVAKTDAAGDDQADSDGSTLTFRLGTGANATTGGVLAKGKSVTMTFQVTIEDAAAGTMVKNTAELKYLASKGVEDTVTADTKTPIRPYADLVVKKTGPATARPGTTVAYTVVVTNNGPDPAIGVKLEDTVSGMDGATADPASVDIGRLAKGASKTFTISVKLPADAKPESVVNDLAKVTSTSLDPNESNNSDPASTVVKWVSDVTLAKTGPRKVKAGGPITYVITATNKGPDPAAVAQIADNVPDEVVQVTWTCVSTGGACTPPSGSGNAVNAIGPLPVGGTVTVTIKGTVSSSAAGSTLKNNARVYLPTTNRLAKAVPAVQVVTKVKVKRKPPRGACRGCLEDDQAA